MSRELQLLLLLAILISASKFAGHLAQRLLKQPVVFGEILAGVLLGPTLGRIYAWPIFTAAVGPEHWLQNTVTTLASIGVLFLMFVAGLETDLVQLRRVGRSAFWTAVAGVILPFIGGVLVALLFNLELRQAIFIGAVLTATSVSIATQTLMELGQLNSREGFTILGAAVIDDVLGIILLSIVIAFGIGHADAQRLPIVLAHAVGDVLGVPNATRLLPILFTLLLMALFFLLVISLRRYFSPLLTWVSQLRASHAVPATAIVLLFLLAVGSEYIGQMAAITGAYLIGVLLGRTPFRQEIIAGIHPLTYAFFVPIFFVSIGLNTTLTPPNSSYLFIGTIVMVAVCAKIVGCGLGARYTGMTPREALRVGVGMISRGEVELIVAQVGFSSGLIAASTYTALIIVVLASTLLTPVLMRLTFPHGVSVEAQVFESVTAVETREDESLTRS